MTDPGAGEPFMPFFIAYHPTQSGHEPPRIWAAGFATRAAAAASAPALQDAGAYVIIEADHLREVVQQLRLPPPHRMLPA